MFEPSKPRNRIKAVVIGAMLLGGLLSHPAGAQSDAATLPLAGGSKKTEPNKTKPSNIHGNLPLRVVNFTPIGAWT